MLGFATAFLFKKIFQGVYRFRLKIGKADLRADSILARYLLFTLYRQSQTYTSLSKGSQVKIRPGFYFVDGAVVRWYNGTADVADILCSPFEPRLENQAELDDLRESTGSGSTSNQQLESPITYNLPNILYGF